MKKTETKSTKKSTKKVAKFIPAYVIDITDCYSIEETMFAIALAKLNYALNEYEIKALVTDMLEFTNELALLNAKKFTLANGEKVVISADGIKVKKPNIFRRFWNWVTRK